MDVLRILSLYILKTKKLVKRFWMKIHTAPLGERLFDTSIASIFASTSFTTEPPYVIIVLTLRVNTILRGW